MIMDVAKTISQVREIISAAKTDGKTIGFVPTMGALHQGHFSLIEAAKKNCDFVIVSIFVNPTQFGPCEDVDKYPNTFEADCENCRSLGVDLIFAPSAGEMYPSENITWVSVDSLDEGLCGRSRPGHFRGVTTVCAKLFNIVGPDIAFFGQKDAQQAIIIKRMVADLNMPLKIQVCPTVRSENGLALSSRNSYLTDSQLKQAPLIYAALQEAEILIASDIRDVEAIRNEMKKVLEIAPDIRIDYIDIVSAESLKPLDMLSGEILIAIAAFLGNARLIDNIIVDVDKT